MNRETIIKKMRDIDLIDFRDEDEDEHVAELVNKVSSIVALAVAKEREECGWQPIETAPKDGRTLLLGGVNSCGNWRTMRGQWMSQDYIDQNWEDPDAGEPDWFETCVEADEVPNCWPITPSHWMPLPPPPSAIRARGEAV